MSTRKRTQLLLQMWRSANVNRSPIPTTETVPPGGFEYKHDIELVLYVDEDDPETRKVYYDSIIAYNTVMILGPRPEILGQTTNRCFQESTGEICMLCTDDVIFHTPGWDELVIQEFLKYPDRIVLVYGEDGIQHGRTATLPFLHRNWVKTIGRYLPTYFIGESGDRWLTDVANRIGRKVYLPNLYVQHLHPAHGTMPCDATYTERLNMRRNKGNTQYWRQLFSNLESERKSEANKLKKFITEFK